MSETVALLAIVGGVLSLCALVAGIVVVFRASYAKAQLEQQRGHIVDLDARKDYLEEENKRLAAEKITAEAERDLAVEMVTQRADLARHHEEVVQAHKRMFNYMTTIKTLLEEVLKNVRQRGHRAG